MVIQLFKFAIDAITTDVEINPEIEKHFYLLNESIFSLPLYLKCTFSIILVEICNKSTPCTIY